MLRNFKKICASVSALLLIAVTGAPTVSFAEEAKTVCVFDMDLSDVQIGDNLPGVAEIGGALADSFVVGEVSEDISESGKAAVAHSERLQGFEAYFPVQTPIISKDNADEDMDYIFRVKLKTSEQYFSDMQLGIITLDTENISNRISFVRMINNHLINKDSDTVEQDKWYNLLVRLHVGAGDSEDFIGYSLYDIDETAPNTWDVQTQGASVSTNQHYVTNREAVYVGVKGYRQPGCAFTDFSVYGYNSEAYAHYESVAEEISSIMASVEGGTMSYDEVTDAVAQMNDMASTVEGNLQGLLTESFASVDEGVRFAETVRDEISEVSSIEITEENFNEVYDRVDKLSADVDNIWFSDIRDELRVQIDQILEKITGIYEELTEYDAMDYTDSASMESGGWTSEGEINFENGVCVNGQINKEFKNAIDTSQQCDYTIELQDAEAKNNGFSVNIGGLSYGVIKTGDKYYPFIDDVIGSTEIAPDTKYNYLLKIKNDETAGNTAELRVYGNDKAFARAADVEKAIGTGSYGTISVSSDGSVFGAVSKEVYPQNYASDCAELLYTSLENTGTDDAAVQEKENLIAQAQDKMTSLRTGAVLNYLQSMLNQTNDELVKDKLDAVIEKLDADVTEEDINTAKKLIESLKDSELKQEYYDKINPYIDYMETMMPVIESVGIEGNIKAGSTVSAKVNVVDRYENGSYRIEWLLSGAVSGTDESYQIPSNAAGMTLRLRVTAKNSEGTEGTPVTTDSVTIAGNAVSGGGGISSGGSGGGGGHTGGSGITGPTSPGIVTGDDENQNQSPNDEPVSEDKKFADIQGHWAENEITAMANKGIVSGVSDNLFEPDRNITRAEFTKLLSTAFGLTADGSIDKTFTDVSDDSWYHDYVMAAYINGVADGYGDMFMPDADITREQSAVMITRMYKKYFEELAGGDAEVFSDYDEISSWALPDIEVALNEGLIYGVSDTELAPQKSLSRAEAVVMLYRALNKLGFI